MAVLLKIEAATMNTQYNSTSIMNTIFMNLTV